MQPVQTNQTGQDVSIADIESAINVWRNRSPAPVKDDEPLVLCQQARTLADVYARMIIGRLASISQASLSDAQLAALKQAIA